MEATGILPAHFTGEGGEKEREGESGQLTWESGEKIPPAPCPPPHPAGSPGLQPQLVGRGASFPGQGAASSWESGELAKCSWMDWASQGTQTLPERGVKDPPAPRGDQDLVSLPRLAGNISGDPEEPSPCLALV